MAEEFVFADTPEYVWADLPGNEWADSLGGDVVRLCRPSCKSISTRYRCKSISTRYRCKSIRGGQIMSSAETIRVGHGGTILLQLQAENMETGITAPLPESVMGTISRVVLVLSNTVKIDSAVDGVGLGQGLPFDHTINPLAAKLAITVGDLAQMIGLGGNYPRPHLDVYFGGTTPIEFAAMPIKVFPAS